MNDGNQPYWQQNTSPPPPPLRMYEPPPPRRSKIPWWVILLGAIGFSLCLCTSSVMYSTHSFDQAAIDNSNSQIQNIPTTVPTNTPMPVTNQHYHVGDVVDIDQKWEITINSVNTNNGSDFIHPKQGNVFLSLTVTAKNISNESETFSSLIMFDLNSVSDGTKYNVSFGSETSPDSTVASGLMTKGVINFEVPSNVHQFYLTYSDIISSTVVWDIRD